MAACKYLSLRKNVYKFDVWKFLSSEDAQKVFFRHITSFKRNDANALLAYVEKCSTLTVTPEQGAIILDEYLRFKSQWSPRFTYEQTNQLTHMCHCHALSEEDIVKSFMKSYKFQYTEESILRHIHARSLATKILDNFMDDFDIPAILQNESTFYTTEEQIQDFLHMYAAGYSCANITKQLRRHYHCMSPCAAKVRKYVHHVLNLPMRRTVTLYM